MDYNALSVRHQRAIAIAYEHGKVRSANDDRHNKSAHFRILRTLERSGWLKLMPPFAPVYARLFYLTDEGRAAYLSALNKSLDDINGRSNS